MSSPVDKKPKQDDAGEKKPSDPTDSILIDLSITQTPMMNMQTLEQAYRKAVAEGKSRFEFEGRKFHTSATKFLIERITGKKLDSYSKI